MWHYCTIVSILLNSQHYSKFLVSSTARYCQTVKQGHRTRVDGKYTRFWDISVEVSNMVLLRIYKEKLSVHQNSDALHHYVQSSSQSGQITRPKTVCCTAVTMACNQQQRTACTHIIEILWYIYIYEEKLSIH